jgi:hypothetical protein
MNFLKTKLFKKAEGKTKRSRFLEKTGKNIFQGFLGMKKNKEERIQETRYKDTRYPPVLRFGEAGKQITNPKLQIPNKSQITNHPPSLRFGEAGKLQITVALLLVLLPATFFFLQNKSQDSNNQITVSSLNSSEQFQIKKTKDSLNITSENSAITLNQIKTEKKTLKSILILLKLVT